MTGTECQQQLAVWRKSIDPMFGRRADKEIAGWADRQTPGRGLELALVYPGGAVSLEQNLRAALRPDLRKQVTIGSHREVTADVVAREVEMAYRVQVFDIELVHACGRITNELVAFVAHVHVLTRWIDRHSDPQATLVGIEVVAANKGAGSCRVLGQERLGVHQAA